ncbi:MAG: hypothetical protein MUF04_05840 [Akkermansiaceae bacterium]|nr:hypothetical protein [Akkermansiaceae bacterium]
MKRKLIQEHALLLAVCALASASHATAQEVDPFAPPSSGKGAFDSIAPSEEEIYGPVDLSACYEVFTLSMEQAASFQREQISDDELYQCLVAGLKEKTVKQEIFNIIRLKSGQKATNESILEHIYPTEYKSGSTPESLGLGVAAGSRKSGEEKAKQPPANVPTEVNALPPTASIEGLISPAIPTAFDTRNLGETIEIEPSLAPDRKSADLRMKFEQTLLVGQTTHGQGLNECTVPEFETRRFNTDINVQIGKPGLLSTFNRPSNSKADPKSADQVSYAFVTVTLIQP